MDRQKKVATMAAVIAYIKTGEDIEARQKMGPMDPLSPEPPVFGGFFCGTPNIWGLTGRQVMMQANTMMQLRMFR